MKQASRTLNAFEQVGDFLLGVWGAFDALFLNRRPVERIVSRRSPTPVKVEEGTVTVLAIDDDAVYLNSISEMLQEKGWKVLSATNAV